jgi:hypothetical protein
MPLRYAAVCRGVPQSPSVPVGVVDNLHRHRSRVVGGGHGLLAGALAGTAERAMDSLLADALCFGFSHVALHFYPGLDRTGRRSRIDLARFADSASLVQFIFGPWTDLFARALPCSIHIGLSTCLETMVSRQDS